MLTGIAFGVIPARNASRLNREAALRFEYEALVHGLHLPEDMEALAPLQPRARAFLDSIAGPGLEELPLTDARKGVVAAQSIVPIPLPDVAVEERDFRGVRVFIYRPAKRVVPAALYFHGGGWVLCNRETHDRLMRELAARSGAAIVFVEYSLSPEVKYPVALEEAYTALQHVAEHGREYGLDASRLAVAGDSAGANLATAVCMLAKRRGCPQIQLQVLLFPVTDAAMDSPSYREFADGYFLTRAQMHWFWDCYAPDRARRAEATASPLRAALEDLRGLPPTLVITADHDVLRDEGEAYAQKLAAAGVPVTVTRYPGTIHAFMVLNAFTQDPSPRNAIEQTAAALRTALFKEESI